MRSDSDLFWKIGRLSVTLAGVAALPMVFLASPGAVARRFAPAASSQTQVVLLGTGNPPADPDRSGPATAVVVNGTPYLVDFGAGVVRRAKSAVVDKGIAGARSRQAARRVRHASPFRSHRWLPGSDPDAVGDRTPRSARGARPGGIKAMTEHLLEAYRADFETRNGTARLYTVGAFPEGHAVNAHEIRPASSTRTPTSP